jgi:hypothetical protein
MAHSASSAWDRTTALATLGLARHTPAIDDLLPDGAVKLPAGSLEQGVLRCAAAALLMQLAGRRSPAAAFAAPVRAGSLAEGTIADAALRRLARLSAEGPKELIGEWLTTALKSGKVLPPQWIPPIFETLAAEMRMEYAPLFGQRIHWLASQDARWNIEGAGKEFEESDWLTGSIPERSALLRRVRATDPGAGRAWVEATWSTDAPEAREAFVQAFRYGLSSADEPFLEKALDDKRKGVRQAAAENLARLPDSAFVQRSLMRLQPLLEFEPRPRGLLARLSSRKLRIDLPQALDKAAVRDGLETKPPANLKVGERSFQFMQMLSIPPPAQWSRRFDCTAVELLEAAGRSDYAQEIFTALCSACVRHPDAEWICALCASWRSRATEQDPNVAAGIATLLAALPAEARDQQLQTEVSALRSQGSTDLGMHLLACSNHAWSSATTAVAFDLLLNHIRGSGGANHALSRSSLEPWGRRVEAATAAAAAKQVLEKIGPESPARNAVEQLLDLIEFRIDMHKELLA